MSAYREGSGVRSQYMSAANSHAGGQQGPAYGKAVGGYETGLVGGGLVGAAAHYPSFSLKSEVDYRPSEGQDAKVQSAQRTPRARSGMNDGNAKLTGPAVDRAAYGIPARVSEASMKVPSREVPGSSTHDRSHDRFYGHAALRRTDDGGNLASNRDREVSYIDRRVLQPAMSYGDGKSHQPAQRRIFTHEEAERLRQQKGQRRQSQVLDAEMKIASIHSRMAALERSIFSQGESNEPSAQQRAEDQASGRVPGRQLPMATKGLPPIPTGEVHSEQRAIIIQRPGWKAAPISTEAAEHDAQKGHVNTLSNGPTPKSTDAAERSPLSITDSVDLDLMNVLSDNRRELSSSHKANGIPAQTTKSALVVGHTARHSAPTTNLAAAEAVREPQQAMPAAPEEQAAVQRAAMAAEKQMADFDKSLQKAKKQDNDEIWQELRDRAEARDRFAQSLSQKNALRRSQQDAENSSGTSAGLSHRARELKEQRTARGIGGNVSSAEDSNANAEVPLVLNRRAAQRSAAPPVTPQLTASTPSHSYWASPYASDGRENASAGESGVVFSASYRRGEMKSQSANHSGSERNTLEFDTRNRQGRGAHIKLDESTPVISASAFQGYTNRTEALPPGWELKIDLPSGRKFYVNHQQKSISWDRPRVSHGKNDSTQGTSRSLSGSMNGTQSPQTSLVSSAPLRSGSSIQHSLAKMSSPPALLSRESRGMMSTEDVGHRMAPRHISADRMGGSLDGAYFESEEKRRAEMEVDRRRAAQQKSGAQYDEALRVSSAAPKRWTASEFLKHLEDLDASRFEETPVLADSSSSSLAQHELLRTSLDSTRLAALERERMEEDARLQSAFSNRCMQPARDPYSLRMHSNYKPGAQTLNLLVSAKEKLQSYVFSKVDDDDVSFDDSSPIKDADKASDDLNYERWCAESLKDLHSDNEDDDSQGEHTIDADAIRRDRGIDSSWMRSSMTEDGANCFQYQQLFCGFAGLASVKPEARSETGSNSFHKAVQGAGQVAESLGVESRFSVG